MRNALFHVAGLAFLTLAKAKHRLAGYTSPKPFSSSDIDRCIDYDLKVVDEWLNHLARYTGGTASLNGKSVLELGPGSDLGVGVYLLARGASSYHAGDVNDLTAGVPDSFYTRLLERIGRIEPAADLTGLAAEARNARRGAASRLKLVVREDFDLESAFGAAGIDLVFSQAAFEHFDDVERTVRQLSGICKPGARIVAEIDLKTHSRWIRDKDPNNIYRYSSALYGRFRFRGIPNRLRPYRYREIFESHGWADVSIVPLEQLSEHQRELTVDRQFRDPRNQLEYLSVVLCATKA